MDTARWIISTAPEIADGDWRKLCCKPGGSKMLCRTSITGSFATGQMAVRLDIIQREGDGTARLQLFAPVDLLSHTTSLPLAQFASVHRGAPAQTLEQDIDE